MPLARVQRWDVVKWGVTVNVALATATAALNTAFSFIPFVLAVLVALVSWLLVLHYNRRTTGARNTATHLVCQMKKKGIDYDGIVGTNTASDYSTGFEYDKPELNLFTVILFGSVFLPLLSAIWKVLLK